MKKEKTTRVSENFYNDLNDIKKARIKSGKDKKKLSDRRITELITKNKYWKDIIKEEIIDLNQEQLRNLLKDE